MKIRAASAPARSVARAKVLENVRRLSALGQRNLEAVLRELDDARARLVAMLATGSEFDQTRAREMIAAVESEIVRLKYEMRKPWRDGYVEALDRGDAMATDAARSVLPPTDSFRISTGVSVDLIDAATGRSADLVGEIAESARARLNALMRRAATGSNRPADVAAEIGAVLSAEGRPEGIFGTLAVQIERVHRTETHALHETAAKARAIQIAREVPWRMLEVWVAVIDGRTRDAHLDMHGAAVEVGERFNFGAGPVWSKVSYEEAQRRGGTLGLAVTGPHDAILPAEDAVNCRCTRTLRRGERKETA